MQMVSEVSVFMGQLSIELEMKVQPATFVPISGGDLHWRRVHEAGFGVGCLPGHRSLAVSYWHLCHHR